MTKKLLLSLCVIIFLAVAGYSQGGTLKGTIKGPDGTPLSYTNVTLEQEGKTMNTTLTDGNGEYSMYNIAGGIYTLKVMLPSGQTQTLTGVEIASSGVKLLDFETQSSTLNVVEVKYIKPVFKSDETTTGASLSREQITKNPGRNLEGALATASGVSVSDGQIQAVRGNRGDGQATYVDGVKVSGMGSIPIDAVGETEMIQGGIPAEYGDATSVTNITTRGIPKSLMGGVELRGSVEGYNNFLAAATILGPLLKGKNQDDAPRIGFMLTAQGQYNQDYRPLQGGSWRASDEAIEWLTKNPLRYEMQPNGVAIYHSNTEYLTFDSEINGKKVFQKKRTRDFGSNYGYAVNGKIDFMPPTKKGGMVKNRVQLSVGGFFAYDKYINNWATSYSMFNAKNAPEVIQYEARATARLNHVVFTDTTGKGILKNISYNINVGYTYTNQISQSPLHKDRFFNYGHIGKFKTQNKDVFALEDIVIDSVRHTGMWVYKGFYPERVTFEPGTANPDLAYYTQNFVNQFTVEDVIAMSGGNNYDLNAYRMFGALVNGNMPNGTYSIYAAPGTISSSYSKSNSSTIQARASLSISLKNHDIKLGFQFEKETHRSFSLNPVSLWDLMYQEANAHIRELDVNNPIFKGTDTVMFNYLVGTARPFDRNLRTALGKDPNGTEWLDIHSMDPSTFSLDMFSAEELLTTGAYPYVSYMGYDHTGKKYNRKTSINDFFNGDSKGNKYGMGAYEPNYMAMYIQDKFSIKNLIFNVGVRIDRFDANQPVLKDPYLFRDAYTVGEMMTQGFARIGSNSNNPTSGTFVANAGDDWVVYVNQKDEVFDAASFSKSMIVGYRQGNTWYNAEGQAIADPEALLGASGGPVLKNAIDKNQVSKVEASAFEDYKPQWTVMPRISFAFPVNMDNSLFFANYSIITTRPTNLNIDLVQYFLVDKYLSGQVSLNNPNLKPQQSVDYEIGFKQKIGARSAINISAFYSEKKNMIQTYRFTGAYPSTYYSYDNLDFGTVQGITLGYTLQKTKGIALNVGYSIQFAKGTGSSAESQKSIVASGQPNLRTLTNLSFDQRHSLTATISYEFGTGTEYTGPTSKKGKVDKEGNTLTKETRWLENVGIYLTLGARSGMPYSRSSKPYSTYVSGTNSQLTGSLNGSFKPWQFQCDLHIEKGFNLVFNSKKVEKEKAAAKRGMLTVYLDITNLLNLKNIVNVYSYTGSPEDDGYLSAEQYQQNIQAQFYTPSYIDYYTMRVKDPYNYARPCRVNLGLQLSF
ncbi:MAG: TonB-dependent receptor [Bacteroidales bacterium]|nr:TonB-dependent receptor [Bacteroidales bacterium]